MPTTAGKKYTVSYDLDLVNSSGINTKAINSGTLIFQKPETVSGRQSITFTATGVVSTIQWVRSKAKDGSGSIEVFTLDNVTTSVESTENTFASTIFVADVLTYSDYYPFGQLVPTRHGSSDSYRYGFNGKENDNEIKGEGNSYDFGSRSIYDGRIARFISLDPRWREFADLSPYAFAANSPVVFIDEDGEGPVKPLSKYFDALIAKIGKEGIIYQAFVSANNTSLREFEKWATNTPGTDRNAKNKIIGAIGEGIFASSLLSRLNKEQSIQELVPRLIFQDKYINGDRSTPDISLKFETVAIKTPVYDRFYKFEHTFSQADGTAYLEEFESTLPKRWNLQYEVKTLKPTGKVENIIQYLTSGINQINDRLDKISIIAPESVGVLVTDSDAYMKAWNDTTNKGKVFRETMNEFLSQDNTRLFLIKGLWNEANRTAHFVKDNMAKNDN